MPKTTLNLRVDKSVKKDCEKVLNELGISMSAAITLYLKMIVRHNGIPFDLRVVKNEPKKKTAKTIDPEFDDDFDDLDFSSDDSIRKAIEKL